MIENKMVPAARVQEVLGILAIYSDHLDEATDHLESFFAHVGSFVDGCRDGDPWGDRGPEAVFREMFGPLEGVKPCIDASRFEKARLKAAVRCLNQELGTEQNGDGR